MPPQYNLIYTIEVLCLDRLGEVYSTEVVDHHIFYGDAIVAWERQIEKNRCEFGKQVILKESRVKLGGSRVSLVKKTYSSISLGYYFR